jgi:hypothetical protein
MPAMAAVARSRMTVRDRRWVGTREINSTVSSKARGVQAAMIWLIGFGWACRMLAATEAATPRVSVARTAQRRRRCATALIQLA